MTETAREPGRDWRCLGPMGNAMRWTRGPLVVVSELAHAFYPDGSGDIGPQWMISVSYKRRRPTDKQLRRALRAFDMVGTEEDNHMPGMTRQFWLPVDPARRTDCECKVTEDTFVEPDGHRWTNPKPDSNELCRGCEYEQLAASTGTVRPCPIHSIRSAVVVKAVTR